MLKPAHLLRAMCLGLVAVVAFGCDSQSGNRTAKQEDEPGAVEGVATEREIVAADTLRGCVCRIDEASGTIEIAPWNAEEKTYESTAQQTVRFHKNTQFVLKREPLVATQAGKESKVPLEDGELQNRADLVNHRVEVTCEDRRGELVAIRVSLDIASISYPTTITYPPLPGGGYSSSTRCSCGQEN